MMKHRSSGGNGIPYQEGWPRADLECFTAFYTEVLGFQVSDVHPEDLMSGGAVEFRNPDIHGLEFYRGVDQAGSDGPGRLINECHGVRSIEETIVNPLPGQDARIPR